MRPRRLEGGVGTQLAASEPALGRAVLAAVLALALAVRVMSALAVPAWQGPDEPKHFEYARLLVDKGGQFLAERRLPNLGDESPQLQQEIIASLARHHYWEYVGWLPSGPQTPDPLPRNFSETWPEGTGLQLHRPSLYYFLVAAALAPWSGAPLETQLLVGRLLSALLSALTVWFVYLAGREVGARGRFVPAVGACLVAALPMHVFLGGTVNSDNLLTLAGSIAVLGALRGARRGWGAGEWALALGGLALAVATKRAGVMLAVPVALGLLCRWPAASGRVRLGAVAIAGLGAAGLAAAWQVAAARQALLWWASAGTALFKLLDPALLLSPALVGLVPRLSAALFCSFWGIFGWFNVLMGVPVYVALAVASGLALLGLGRHLWQTGRRGEAGFGAGVVLFLSSLAAVVLAMVERLVYLSPQQLPQGRYLFGVVAAIALVHALGWRALLGPARAERLLGPVVVGLGLLLVAAYSFWVLPFYARF